MRAIVTCAAFALAVALTTGAADAKRLATAELRGTWGGWDKPVNLGWLTSEKSGVYDLSYLREALNAKSQ
jgi:hypothetical protein